MNRLQHETSPYLLQHAHNPVDWYAWKPEAFERARAEQKPILVSIGYSTCHWCHVMERESFENQAIAVYMNEHFINVKVDREERPDVDAIYMEACQILSGGGGWPLNCFLTPEGKPFYAGTYYPPAPVSNRPSWPQVLQHMAQAWGQKRDTVLEQADKLLGYILKNDQTFVKKIDFPAAAAPEPEVLTHIFHRLRERFDREEGGFGGAPKFPSTMAILYLLQYHHVAGEPEALDHALLSLHKMIHGGMYDQLGGGFARYATDREWLIPHFEKMLYDNALLVTVIAEAYKLVSPSNHPDAAHLRETMEETLDYIAREMTHPEGGFYSAQDADSEGVEGKFYVWDKSEIETALGPEAALFCSFYGVSEEGNWEHHNILWRPGTYERFAELNQINFADLKNTLRHCRGKLLSVRNQRIWPGLDDKILIGWNALMASAYAHAFTALGHEPYRQAALRNVDFLLEKFTGAPDQPAALRHTWKNGQAQYDAFLDDYAFLTAALLDVYQISFDDRYLRLAETYAEYAISAFFDADTGLFFYTRASQTDVIARKKDLMDSATPSGNSTMTHNLQRLGILVDRPEWRQMANRMLAVLDESIRRYPLSFERWASALMQQIHPIHEIAVVGDNAVEKALAIQRGFLPNKVIAASVTANPDLPLLADKPASSDAYIYVCRDFACQRPVQTLAEFWKMGF